MAIESSLIYENIMFDTNSNYRVTVGGIAGGTITGVLNAPMPIAGGNEYESVKSVLGNVPIIGDVMSGIDSIAKYIRLTGNDTIQAIEQTRKVWQESRNPQFSVELTFWQIDNSKYEAPISTVNRLYSALFPIRKEKYVVGAPLGYKFIGNNGDATGTVSLTIGKWFRANGLVVMDANFTPSLEVGADGTPLYFTGTVTLEPYKMVTYQEYLGWFPKTSGAGGSGSSELTKKSSFDLNSLTGPLKKY